MFKKGDSGWCDKIITEITAHVFWSFPIGYHHIHLFSCICLAIFVCHFFFNSQKRFFFVRAERWTTTIWPRCRRACSPTCTACATSVCPTTDSGATASWSGCTNSGCPGSPGSGRQRTVTGPPTWPDCRWPTCTNITCNAVSVLAMTLPLPSRRGPESPGIWLRDPEGAEIVNAIIVYGKTEIFFWNPKKTVIPRGSRRIAFYR